MGKLGSGELIVILVVALLIFGPSKLPALGKMAGKAVGTLKRYADSANWDELMKEEDETPTEETNNKAEVSADETVTESDKDCQSQIEQAS